MQGQTEEEKIEIRKKLIKGFIQEKVARRIHDCLVSVQETKSFIVSATSMIWNKFYKTVWREKCHKIVEQKKNQDISTKVKRKK